VEKQAAELLELTENITNGSASVAFEALRRVRGLVAWLEEVCVDKARAEQWSWGQIGRALGRTKQGAHARHAGRVQSPPARPRTPMEVADAEYWTLELTYKARRLRSEIAAKEAEFDALMSAGEHDGAFAMHPELDDLREQLDTVQEQLRRLADGGPLPEGL